MSDVLSSITSTVANSDILSTIASQLGIPVWKLSLQTAKWRGIPFFVEGSTFPDVNRRVVVHEYPYRNAWNVEDLGLSTQRVTLNCFYNSQYATSWSQRKTLTAALMTQVGTGELIHPSAGSRQAVLEKSTFNEAVDLGGVIRFSMTFILNPPQDATTTNADTQSQLATQSSQGLGSSISSFLNSVGSTISSGLASVGISSISSLFSTVSTILGDAAIVEGAFFGIDSFLGGQQTTGIYYNGNLSSANPYFNAVDTTQPYSIQATQCVELAISNTVALKANTTAQFNELTTLTLTDNDPNDVANAIQAAIANITASIINPLDQCRLLATAYTNLSVSTDPFTALMRQTILANMLPAVASTTLQSQQDANNLLSLLSPLFDQEISITSDITAFMGLRNMKAALVIDLNTRGINLPQIISVSYNKALPAFVIAYNQYGDATRADEITIRNNPVHPAFIQSPVQLLSY